MCFKFKKRKNIKPIDSKYQIGDLVLFRYKDELTFGWIYLAYLDIDEKVLYDIQVGGQATHMIYRFKEENIIGLYDKVMNKQ